MVHEALAKNADSVVKSLWSLSDELVFRYADGFRNFRESSEERDGPTFEILGYPEWWLDAVGFRNGPPPPPTKPKCCNPPKKNPKEEQGQEEEASSSSSSSSSSSKTSVLRGRDNGDKWIEVY